MPGKIGLFSSKGAKLLRAVELGDTKKVEAALKAGGEASFRGEDGVTPMLAAVAQGREDLVKLLAGAGADLDAASDDGETALSMAIATERVSLVRLLITSGANVKKVDASGSTPAIVAAIARDPEIFEVVLEAGADVNQKGERGRTPLHQACAFGRLQNIHALLAAGADTAALDDAGRTPLMLFVTELPRWATNDAMLGAASAGRSPISVVANMVAAAEAGAGSAVSVPPGYYEVAKKLIKGAANAKSKAGDPLLAQAIRAGVPPELIQFLLESGADPNGADSTGALPLALAEKHPNPNVSVLLKSLGATR